MFEHVDYPHMSGSLYDCPACENKCFCLGLDSQCIRCAQVEFIEFESE